MTTRNIKNLELIYKPQSDYSLKPYILLDGKQLKFYEEGTISLLKRDAEGVFFDQLPFSQLEYALTDEENKNGQTDEVAGPHFYTFTKTLGLEEAIVRVRISGPTLDFKESIPPVEYIELIEKAVNKRIPDKYSEDDQELDDSPIIKILDLGVDDLIIDDNGSFIFHIQCKVNNFTELIKETEKFSQELETEVLQYFHNKYTLPGD